MLNVLLACSRHRLTTTCRMFRHTWRPASFYEHESQHEHRQQSIIKYDASFWYKSTKAIASAAVVAAAALAFTINEKKKQRHHVFCQSIDGTAYKKKMKQTLVYGTSVAKDVDSKEIGGLTEVDEKREPNVESVNKSAQQRSALPQFVDVSASLKNEQQNEQLNDDEDEVAEDSVDPLPPSLLPLPSLPSGAPAAVPYLIVGGGVAAIAAARSIRAQDPLSRVLIITSENVPPYLRPPLSKELWRRSNKRVSQMLSPEGDMKEHSWLFFEPDSFYLTPQQLVTSSHGGVALWPDRQVVALNVEDNFVELDNGERIGFDSCLLATGGRPRHLQQFEAADQQVKNRVRYFRNIVDFHSLRDEARRARRVVVIGGGFLGTELAVSLAESAKRDNDADQRSVVQIFKEDSGCMAHVLPTCLAEHTMNFVKSSGVLVRPGVEVLSADPPSEENSNDVRLRLSDGSELCADLIVVAVGLDAVTDLASTASLEIDERQGGYLVNAELRARNRVWVAGDACSYYDVLLGRRRVEHINHAEESGRVAGLNMTGANQAYRHQSSFWSSLGPAMTWDAVGRIDSKLQTYAFFAQSLSASSDNAPDYSFPGVVFYVEHGRLVGVLLWNLSDELYRDPKKFAPSRLHLARSMLAARHAIGNPDIAPVQLESLAKQFDLYATVDEDYQELLKYVNLKESERQAAVNDSSNDFSNESSST